MHRCDLNTPASVQNVMGRIRAEVILIFCTVYVDVRGKMQSQTVIRFWHHLVVIWVWRLIKALLPHAS